MGERIGIFGGTFNPVHMGHLVLAQDARERFELDQVLFVPAGCPPHKPAAPLAEAGHRAAMLELAIEGDPCFRLSRCEVDRPGPSYSIDTVHALQAEFPGAALHFIIGADTLPELHAWHRIGELLEACTFVSVSRPGFPLGELSPERLGLPAPWGKRLLEKAVVGHQIGTSSSDIRMRLAEGLSIRYLVPSGVDMYIAEHGLYRG